MKSKSNNKLAKERIEILFKEAEKQFKKFPELAKRYIFIARKIAMKTNLKLCPEHKKKICKKCKSFITPGVNCTVRTNPKTKSVEYICNCGHRNRYGYSREKRKV